VIALLNKSDIVGLHPFQWISSERVGYHLRNLAPPFSIFNFEFLSFFRRAFHLKEARRFFYLF